MPKKHYSKDEALDIASKIGLNWEKVNFGVDQFTNGLNVEAEHGAFDQETNVTNDDPAMTGKIAWAHLKEISDYYDRLDVMEKEAEGKTKKKIILPLVIILFLLGGSIGAYYLYVLNQPKQPQRRVYSVETPIKEAENIQLNMEEETPIDDVSATTTPKEDLNPEIEGVIYELPHSSLVLTDRAGGEVFYTYSQQTDDGINYEVEGFRIERINKPIVEMTYSCPPGAIFLSYIEEYDLWYWGEKEYFYNWINDISNEYAVECKQRLLKIKDSSFNFRLINQALAMSEADSCDQIIENDKMVERYETKNNLDSFVFGCGDGGGASQSAYVESPDGQSVVKIEYSITYAYEDKVIGNEKMIYDVLDSIEFTK